jgi:retron-type reverse transcriptase
VVMAGPSLEAHSTGPRIAGNVSGAMRGIFAPKRVGPCFLQPEHGKAIAEGYNVVVDLDLERFFDRVNHDSLMARVAASLAPRPRECKSPTPVMNARLLMGSE